jgi:hypothetical protein
MNSLLQQSGQVTLDGNGYGTITFRPAGESWHINYVSVKTTPITIQAIVRVYLDQIGDVFKQDESFSGSSGDTSDNEYDITDGRALIIEWSQGGAADIATAVIRGTRTVANRGFRAIS